MDNIKWFLPHLNSSYVIWGLSLENKKYITISMAFLFGRANISLNIHIESNTYKYYLLVSPCDIAHIVACNGEIALCVALKLSHTTLWVYFCNIICNVASNVCHLKSGSHIRHNHKKKQNLCCVLKCLYWCLSMIMLLCHTC
jgi:hypothetical protein